MNLRKQNKSDNSYLNNSIVAERDEDIIYYNINIPHNDAATVEFTPAFFNVDLTQPILDHPDDWYMVVNKFVIPSDTIPIFIAEIKNPQALVSTNAFETIYNVYLGYNNVLYSANVTYFQDRSPTNIPAGTFDSSTGLYYYDNTHGYFFIFSYQHFIDMVNIALGVAFAAAVAANPGPLAGALQPYFQYDAATNLISLVGQRTFYDQALASPLPIKVYLNLPMLRYFDGLENIFTYNIAPEVITQLVIKDKKNNWYNPPYNVPFDPTTDQPDYFIMSQEYHTLANWNSLTQILFTSGSLPIKPEIFPITNNNGVFNNSSQINSQNIFSTKPIVASFIPLIELGPESRTSIQYTNTNIFDGPIINMIGNAPLRKIDINLQWVDSFNNIYQILLSHHKVAILKLVFIKKTLYKKLILNI